MFDALVKAGKIRAIGLSQFHRAAGGRSDGAARWTGLTAPSALQPWYNLVERDKFEGDACATRRRRHGLAVFSYYSLANGFLTGKYRSQDDLDKSPRGLRNIEYLEGRGRACWRRSTRSRPKPGAAGNVALAWTMAQPAITARSPARPASSNWTS